ncbi:MAG: sensor domain-containing diguanylate cyclase [Pseudomonadota bacterium]|nr:sensor domain-containing diguanylate cyclase [Pseudomonadota bacterium]
MSRALFGTAVKELGAKRKSRRTPTIRSRLALLALACVVPASLAAVGLIAYDYQRERGRVVRDSTSTARAMASAVDRELSGIQAALFALATSPDLASDNLASFHHQAKDVLRTVAANNVLLLDAAGRQHMNTLVPFGAPLPSGSMPAFRDVFELGHPLISDIIIGRVLKTPLIALAVPVHRDDKIVYSLIATIGPERLTQILARQRLPPGWIGTIFDSTGAIVARTHEIDRFVGKKGTTALLQRMAEVAEDSLETNTVEGIPVIAVFSRSGISKWTVAIGIPRRDLTNELLQSMGWLVLITFILPTGGLAVAWVIGKRIAGSIHALTAPALALGQGEEVTVPPLYLKEADELADVLTKTSIKLRLAQHQALHDALTGLPNRMLLTEFVNHQVALCRRTGGNFAVLFIDLDGFKAINDAHGHAFGDRLLCAIGARLKARLRESDMSARLGGDEFAAVLINAGLEGAVTVAAKLVNGLSLSYEIDSLIIEISVSIGVAIYPDSATATENLLRCADKAMYEAKARGKKRYAVAVTAEGAERLSAAGRQLEALEV